MRFSILWFMILFFGVAVAASVQRAALSETAVGLGSIHRTRMAEQTTQKGSASSELTESSGLVHNASRVGDRNYTTAWCEGVADDGIGQWVELRSPCNSETFRVIGVVPGYQKTSDTFFKNNRVRLAAFSVSIATSGASAVPVWSGTVEFSDAEQIQWFEFPAVECRDNSEAVVRLQVQSVYPGSKYRDTCVSEIQVAFEPK